MKTFTITCGDCGNTGFLHLAGVVPIECHCQDPSDPDSRHHKPNDCSACDGSGHTGEPCQGGYPGGLHRYTEYGREILCPLCDGTGWKTMPRCRACGGCGGIPRGGR